MADIRTFPSFEDVGPDIRHAEFVQLQCRTCEDSGPWGYRDDEPARHAAHEWMDDHEAATGHRKFYRWSVIRNTGEIVRLPRARRR